MKEPLISVIVPIYTTDRYTGLCIESIINQTYQNLEIILVDDGSTDRCPELCDLYATKDKRIKVIHKKNGGLVSGRKAGMEIATGEYVGYVDGDDWLDNGYFESVYNEIFENTPDVIISGWTRALFNQKVAIKNQLNKGYYIGDNLKKLKSQMISFGKFYKPGISTYVWNKVFKRELVYACQMNVNEMLMTGEDACVSYAAILKSNSVTVTGNVDYHYRQHEDSMLKRRSNHTLEMERMKILYNHLLSIANNDQDLRTQVIDYVLSSCIIRLGGLCPDLKTFIFGTDFEDKKVVVYGAGTFGQLFMAKLMEKGVCTVTGWLDDDYWEYRRSCLNVDPVESVNDFDFDYLILASIDGEATDNLCERFKRLGVKNNRFITLDIPCNIRESLLNEYLGGR